MHPLKINQGFQAFILILIFALWGIQLSSRLIIWNTPDPSFVMKVEHAKGAENLLIGQKLNINKATYQDLRTLPGMGPVLADRLLKYRQKNGPFQKISELKKINGIGSINLKKFEAFLCINE